jgi:hypothetical protein
VNQHGRILLLKIKRLRQQSAQRQMLLNMRAICGAAYLSQEFAKQIQLVRAVASATSNPSLLKSYLPLSDYICDKQKQHSPNYVHHRDYVE